MTLPTFSAGQRLTGTMLQALADEITAVDARSYGVSAVSTAAGTTTSTSYTSTLSGVGTATTCDFVAPPSGIVMIDFSAQLGSSGVCYVSVALSGASTVAASDDWAIALSAGVTKRGSATHRQTGLTAGGEYTCTMAYKTLSGQVSVEKREIVISPAVAP